LRVSFTIYSPADHPDVIGVGSTTSADALSSFSSVGPAIGGILKPDISAPGSSVNSAYNTNDDAYAVLSGTSMACPHAAGVVALLKSHNLDLTFAEIKTYLYGGAEQKNLTQTGRNCGGISEEHFPNHAFGVGRINAYQSLKQLVGV
jgi:bacillopeptidase F